MANVGNAYMLLGNSSLIGCCFWGFSIIKLESGCQFIMGSMARSWTHRYFSSLMVNVIISFCFLLSFASSIATSQSTVRSTEQTVWRMQDQSTRFSFQVVIATPDISSHFQALSSRPILVTEGFLCLCPPFRIQFQNWTRRSGGQLLDGRTALRGFSGTVGTVPHQ